MPVLGSSARTAGTSTGGAGSRTTALDARTLDAISAIAGVVGAWCPTLSPDGEQIAYVTDRSGLPRLEVARLNAAGDGAGAARQVSPTHQEIVSAAWSPCGEWLAYLVSPGGLIRAELHVMRPDGSAARALAGTDSLSTVLAGCWTTIPDTYAFSLADGRGPAADVCLVNVRTGALRTVATGGFLTVTSVSGDGRRLVARRGSRGRRHLVLADIPAAELAAANHQSGVAEPGFRPPAAADRPNVGGRLRRLLATDFPEEGTDLAEDGRFAPDGRVVYLRTVAGRERFALGMVQLDEWGAPGRLRILAERPDADLESYAVLNGGSSAMLVWNVGGISSIEIRDLRDADRPGSSYRIDLGQRVLPGWSVHRDGRSAILELSEAVAPRSLYHVDLADHGESPAGSGMVARTGEPPHRVAGLPEPALGRDRFVAAESLTYPSTDGLVLQGLLYRPRGADGPQPTVVLLHGGPESQERPAFSILIQSMVAAGLVVFAPNVRGSTGYGSTFVGMDDLDRRESSFQDVPAT
ncbi:MAG: hypothetical protein ABJD68_15180, partial [Nakamurella sp.]